MRFTGTGASAGRCVSVCVLPSTARRTAVELRIAMGRFRHPDEVAAAEAAASPGRTAPGKAGDAHTVAAADFSKAAKPRAPASERRDRHHASRLGLDEPLGFIAGQPRTPVAPPRELAGHRHVVLSGARTSPAKGAAAGAAAGTARVNISPSKAFLASVRGPVSSPTLRPMTPLDVHDPPEIEPPAAGAASGAGPAELPEAEQATASTAGVKLGASVSLPQLPQAKRSSLARRGSVKGGGSFKALTSVWGGALGKQAGGGGGSSAGKEKAAGRLFLSGMRRGSMLPNVMRLHVSRGASPKPQDPPGYQRKRRQDTSGGQLRWSAPPWWEMPNRVGELAEGYDAKQSALIGQAEAALKALSAHGGGGGVPGGRAADAFEASLSTLRAHRFPVQPLRLHNWENLYASHGSVRQPVPGAFALSTEEGGPWLLPLVEQTAFDAVPMEEEGERGGSSQAAPVARPAWALGTSIWAPRKAWCDSKR